MNVRVFQNRRLVFAELREQFLVHVTVKAPAVTRKPVRPAVKFAIDKFQCADSSDLRVRCGLFELLEHTFRLLRDARDHERVTDHHGVAGSNDECGTPIIECYKRYTATNDIWHYFILMK